MTRTFTWAAGFSVGLMLATQGCVIVSGTGGVGGGTTGSNTTTGSHTTTGSDTTTGSYTTTTSTGVSTASGVLPSSCDAAAADDTCTACEKKSCCAELQACTGDAGCAATYGAYSDCLYPGGVESGYTSSYCQAAAGQNSPAGKKPADALIACLTTTCGTDAACGTPAKVTWDNFAADFTESYCSGCHFKGFGFDDTTDPNKPIFKSVPMDIPQFSDDDQWSYWPNPDPAAMPPQGGPKFNPDWKLVMNYKSTIAVSKAIWCGVSVQLPSDCDPVKFPKAERFPPSGTTPGKATCTWLEPSPCPQPTDIERNKMSSWVFDGTPM